LLVAGAVLMALFLPARASHTQHPAEAINAQAVPA
jgi:hypothetical protein